MTDAPAPSPPLPEFYTWGDRREAVRVYKLLVRLGLTPAIFGPYLGPDRPAGAPHGAATDFDFSEVR